MGWWHALVRHVQTAEYLSAALDRKVLTVHCLFFTVDVAGPSAQVFPSSKP